MSTTTFTPNMNLIVPTVGANGDPGPDYGNNQNQDLFILDGHTHAPGSGVQITPAGLNINSNLSFQNNSPYNVYSVIFSSPASTSSLTRIYTNTQSGGGLIDLFYNDGAGNVIALTKAGAVNATIASIPGESYSGGTFTWVQGNGSTTPANFDIGSITIRPNTAGTTNGVVLGPPSGISSLYNVQLPFVPGSATSIMQLDTSGNMSASLVVDNSTLEISSQILQIKPQGVTQGLLAPRTVSATGPLGGIALSSSCGTFSTSSTSVVNVTNLSVTLVTSGRPVFVGLINDGNGTNPDFVQIASTSGILNGESSVLFLNGSTVISKSNLQDVGASNAGTLSNGIPASAFSMIDLTVNGSPGTYTYKVQAIVAAANQSISIQYATLIAYEL
jgi:hypothetical protein